jgi:threonine/homoserine/homoserine lactone efflux protein
MIHSFNFSIFIVSTIVILLTPGPTNTLLAASGMEYGMRGVQSMLACELSGYLLAISSWGFILTPLQHRFSWLAILVRVACSVYLAVLAAKMWRSAEPSSAQGRRTISSQVLFFSTLVNPKGLLFASAVFPADAFDIFSVYLTAMGLFSLLLVPIGLMWTWFGAAFANKRIAQLNRIKLQRAIAVTIGLFSMTIVWTAFH